MTKADYLIGEGLGVFSEEMPFKREIMAALKSDKETYKSVFAIENREEPGMPDILAIKSDDTAIFLETKYAVNGVIEFERTQIPWYLRNKKLNILVVAYNDKTTNIHYIKAEYLIPRLNGRKFKLQNETGVIE